MRLGADLPSLTQCRACGATYRWRPRCPRCGASAPPRPAPKLRRAPLSQVTSASVASPGQQRAYFDRLVAEAAEKGWKPAAIGMRFKARFGRWPSWPLPSATGVA
jgi:hypothetical protein